MSSTDALTSATTSATASYQTNHSASPASASSMDFYNLLTTQLTNQNPLEPVKETDFLGQMAQFSTLEQLQQLTSGMSTSQTEQRWLDAQDFLGRRVEWTALDGTARHGLVDRIDRDEEDAIWLDVDGSQVALDQVQAVAPGASRGVIIDDIR